MSAFFSQIMKGNKVVWFIYAFLLVLSCTVTISAMSQLAMKGASASTPILRHFICLILGAAAILVIQIMDLKMIRLLSFPYLFGTVVLLVVVYFSGGVNSASSNRFSIIGQPSEYVKFGLILAVTELIIFVRKHDQFPSRFFYCSMLVVGGILALIFLENLSSAFLIASIIIVMLIAGGMGFWRVAKMVILAATIVVAIIAFAFIVPEEKFNVMAEEHPVLRVIDRAYTWRGRIDRFGNEKENADPDHIKVTDKNRQEVYAKVAVCRGGWFPSGIGSSLQRNYLPEAFSDYVFAIAAEEGGFVLGILIVIAYLTLFMVSLYYILFKEQKMYRKLILLGCAFSITFQAAVHIAVSVGAMPVTGQTLPLVSRGGASLVVVSAMFGLIIKMTATPSDQTSSFTPEEEPEQETEQQQEQQPEPEPSSEPTSKPEPLDDDDSIIIIDE